MKGRRCNNSAVETRLIVLTIVVVVLERIIFFLCKSVYIIQDTTIQGSRTASRLRSHEHYVVILYAQVNGVSDTKIIAYLMYLICLIELKLVKL